MCNQLKCIDSSGKQDQERVSSQHCNDNELCGDF